MDRKLGEVPKFLVCSSRIEAYQNSPGFAFTLLLSIYFQFPLFIFSGNYFGATNVFMAVFIDEHG
jgi:hypothetical protein